MKIAMYQGTGTAGDVNANLEDIRRQALAAVEQDANLIIFPELFLSGYNIGDRVRELAEAADGPAGLQAAEIARQTGIAILYGYPERSGADVYNSARLVDGSGETRANYRKTHLYGRYEKSCFQPGDSLIITRLENLNIAILICYDVEFPEAVRVLVSAGAELIAVPTALMEEYCRVANKVVPTRAYESEIFVAYVNRCGVEADTVYCGRSCLVGPDGKEVVRAGKSEELLIADIDSQAIASARKTNPVLEDQRPDLYVKPVEIV